MAITQTNSAIFGIQEAIRTYFHQKLDEVKKAHAKRKLYSETYSELAAMSDRNLKDLGFSRSEIRRLALEATHGI